MPLVPLTAVELSVATLIVGIIAGVAVPFLIYFFTRYRNMRSTLEDRQAMTQRELDNFITTAINEKIGALTARVQKHSDELAKIREMDLADKKELREKIEKIKQEHLKQQLDCQNLFITKETYVRDSAVQKNYMKIIYGTIRQHASILEAELNAINGEDDS